MKKTIKLLSVLCMLTIMSVAFVSCSDDDDKDAPASDPASLISGTYVGTGKLGVAGLGGVIAETYPGMKISVTKSSNEYVVITPYLADNTPFFSNSGTSVYQITQSANGDFRLTSAERPMAQLTISKSGHMEWEYPYVTWGGDSGYSLIFSGDKQK